MMVVYFFQESFGPKLQKGFNLGFPKTAWNPPSPWALYFPKYLAHTGSQVVAG